MIEIGAGGGSIAHLDERGVLRVGPRSAGADPGPACYGRGGEEATLTDATPDVLQFTNGVIQLRLLGLAGQGPVTVYASTNLADWESLLTSPPVTGALDFNDPASTNLATRYYRAVEGP